ncbi:MAG: beta-galactosidase [Candidatus Thermoplasmatota archaeon]|nr:beta-galactosidase [Candidatus Thermoplasmatota archaeon]
MENRMLALTLAVMFLAPMAGMMFGSDGASAAQPEQAIANLGSKTFVDGNPHKVTFDKYSLMIDGQRIMSIGGEFHYWRLPAPEMWKDVLLKMKAANYNTVTIYFYWGFHSPAEGVYDFTGIRDIDYLLDVCEEVGLYVSARPGPYICAEVDAGGFPGWLVAKGDDVLLRCQQPAPGAQVPVLGVYSEGYMNYVDQWFSHVVPIIAKHQITNGGSVIAFQIENEYSAINGIKQYMQELYTMAQKYGINVPIYHNDNPIQGSWADVTDIYGTDMYPTTDPSTEWTTSTFSGLDGLESQVRGYATKVPCPMYMVEYQGGWYDGWGVAGASYDARRAWLNAQYYNIIDKSLLGQGFTMYSHYMFYGGTNWEYWMNPEVYTSYDYGAAVREGRGLSEQYYSMKKIAMQVDGFTDAFAKTDATSDVTASNGAALYKVRTNPDTKSCLVFLRNADINGGIKTTLTATVDGAQYTIPSSGEINMPDRSMKILMVNYNLGNSKLVYSTSELLTKKNLGDRTAIVLFGDENADGETVLKFASEPNVIMSDAAHSWDGAKKTLKLNYKHTAGYQYVLLESDGKKMLFIITDQKEAGKFYTFSSPQGDFLVGGEYLVRGIAVQGNQVSIDIETNSTCDVTVIAPFDLGGMKVNGASVSAEHDATIRSAKFSVSAPHSYQVPQLSNWKFMQETPEIVPEYDDSSWVSIPFGAEMDMDIYGFHYGFTWYRGTFTVIAPTPLDLALEVDARHCYSVYLNSQYLGTHTTFNQDIQYSQAGPNAANGWNQPDPAIFQIPSGLVVPGKNVIAILTESLGHNKNFMLFADAKNPRGVISANMVGIDGLMTEWRIMGSMYGERNGWAMPGFDRSTWQPVSVPDNWKSRSLDYQGIGWYSTNFSVDIPENQDVPIYVNIENCQSKSNIYLNGVMIGRYWDEKGPQHKFILPKGVLDVNGANNLCIAVWNRGQDGGLGKVTLETPFPATEKSMVAFGEIAQAKKAFIPGFECAFALMGICAVALVMRRKKQ